MPLWCNDNTEVCLTSASGLTPGSGANGSVAHRLEHLPDKTKAAQLPYKEIVEKVSGREFNSLHSHSYGRIAMKL